jgi:hypothetical protein
MEYALAHPYLTFVLGVIFIRSTAYLLHWPFRFAIYWLRHRSIMVYGWPPDHLDADGDVVKKVQSERPSV